MKYSWEKQRFREESKREKLKLAYGIKASHCSVRVPLFSVPLSPTRVVAVPRLVGIACQKLNIEATHDLFPLGSFTLCMSMRLLDGFLSRNTKHRQPNEIKATILQIKRIANKAIVVSNKPHVSGFSRILRNTLHKFPTEISPNNAWKLDRSFMNSCKKCRRRSRHNKIRRKPHFYTHSL